MASYSTSQFKNGLKIVIDNEPYVLLSNEFTKPGKGQAFNRIKIRNLKSGRVIERTYKSGESVEAADVMEVEAQYLYQEDDLWFFMNNTTFEQLSVGEVVMKEAAPWLKGGEVCLITLWNDEPITVAPPNFVHLLITETDPGLKGDTSGGGSKPATLETGAVVRVPLFVQTGETIKVDARVGEYIARSKE